MSEREEMGTERDLDLKVTMTFAGIFRKKLSFVKRKLRLKNLREIWVFS